MEEYQMANARYTTHNLGLNVETLSQKYWIQGKTSWTVAGSTLGDTSDSKIKTNDYGSLKFAFGFSLGDRFGMQFGAFVHALNYEVRLDRYTGYYFGTNNAAPIQYLDRIQILNYGLLVNSVYRVGERSTLRTSYGFGKYNNKGRNTKGKYREFELKYYYVINSNDNTAIFIGFQNNQLLTEGIDEGKTFYPGSGDERFPATVFSRNTLNIGVNLPIKFD